jgi:SAM-dependent MidA family methyltransferase
MALVDLLVEEIERGPGVISFRDYMDRVLYQPGLGYYSAGLPKFGLAGDFVTAPEISNLFGASLARQCDSIFAQGCKRQILEFGAGSGRLCGQILQSLTEPCDYLILEISADLITRQQEYLKSCLDAEIFDHIKWLAALPTDFDGVVLGNEVLDAMPVHLLCKQKNWYEQGVGFDGDRFCWRRYADDSEAISAIQSVESELEFMPEGYQTEVNLNYLGWLSALSECCNRVFVLMIDYGYLRPEYYHPERSSGTLICHFHHRAHYDPLIYPGLQDVTASVDFDALADAALESGFNICGISTQGKFLLANGLLDAAADISRGTDTVIQIKIAQQVKTLTLPGEMGDRFRVIGLQKNLDIDIDAFIQG